MKTLKEYITEGILDIEDNIENLMEESLIEGFIKANYNTTAKIQIKKNGNKYMVSTPGTVEVKNNNITELTNGLFEWDEVKSFSCRGCTSLKSLKGAPKYVGGYFSCDGCKSLKDLIGAPKKVEDFYCRDCTSLESLKGAPEKVSRDFHCNKCTSLKDLIGAPKEVGRDFDCYDCTSLKDLTGAPEEVGRNFNCSRCSSLESLKGAPKKVGRDFDCKRCRKKFIEEDVRAVCDVGEVIFV